MLLRNVTQICSDRGCMTYFHRTMLMTGFVWSLIIHTSPTKMNL